MRTILIVTVLLLMGCKAPKEDVEKEVTYVLKPAIGLMDADGDGTDEEYALGIFTVAQERWYIDANENGWLDAGETINEARISLAFNHNTDWQGFIEYRVDGSDWTYSNALDLAVSQSGVVDLGYISVSATPLADGLTVTTTDVVNYPKSSG
jgi:hypothetical protein